MSERTPGEEILENAENTPERLINAHILNDIELQYALQLFPVETLESVQEKSHEKIVDERVTMLNRSCMYDEVKPGEEGMHRPERAYTPFSKLRFIAPPTEEVANELRSLGVVHVKQSLEATRQAQDLAQFTEMVEWYETQEQAKQECLEVLRSLQESAQDDLHELALLFQKIETSSSEAGHMNYEHAQKWAYQLLMGGPLTNSVQSSGGGLRDTFEAYISNVENLRQPAYYTDLLVEIQNHQRAIEILKSLPAATDPGLQEKYRIWRQMNTLFRGDVEDKVYTFMTEQVGYNQTKQGIHIHNRVPKSYQPTRGQYSPKYGYNDAKNKQQELMPRVELALESATRFVDTTVARAQMEYEVLHLPATETKYVSPDDAAKYLKHEKDKRVIEARKAAELLGRRPETFARTVVDAGNFTGEVSFTLRPRDMLPDIHAEIQELERQIVDLGIEIGKLTKSADSMKDSLEKGRAYDSSSKLYKLVVSPPIVNTTWTEHGNKLDDIKNLTSKKTDIEQNLEVLQAELETQSRHQSNISFDWENECINMITRGEYLGYDMKQGEVSDIGADFDVVAFKRSLYNRLSGGSKSISELELRNLQNDIVTFLGLVSRWGLSPAEQTALDHYDSVLQRVSKGESRTPEWLQGVPFDAKQVYEHALDVVMPAQEAALGVVDGNVSVEVVADAYMRLYGDNNEK